VESFGPLGAILLIRKRIGPNLMTARIAKKTHRYPGKRQRRMRKILERVLMDSPIMMDTDRLLDTASDLYDELVFKSDRFYNNKAPAPWVSFFLSSLFTAASCMYYLVRISRYRRAVKEWKGSLRVRTMISAAVDNDDPAFTVVKLCAQSFVFLGAIQINYEVAFLTMLGCFAVASCFDLMRVIIAFREADSLTDYMATSFVIKRKTRNRTQLKPTNVYEDLTRERAIVFMVFITQALLISFVVSIVLPRTSIPSILLKGDLLVNSFRS